MGEEIRLPLELDWQQWVKRWERMQERYLVGRAERFAVMIRMVRDTQPSLTRVLDLGCGPGSLTRELLDAFPHAEIVGVDSEPTLLLLARARLAPFGARAKLVSADLREPFWSESLPAPFDAVVSAAALHWLAPEQLALLYKQLARLVRPGGIFMNADHVGSDYPPIQNAWEKHREEMRAHEASAAADDWDGFWQAYAQAYAQALGESASEIRRRMETSFAKGNDQGLPLAWHVHALKEAGFRYVDCFWRSDGDAVYGGIRAETKST